MHAALVLCHTDLVVCRHCNVAHCSSQEGWRILDFLSHHPESCHILTWLLDGVLLFASPFNRCLLNVLRIMDSGLGPRPSGCICMYNRHVSARSVPRADTGIPKNYRQMPGFGVHTFKMINEAGKETYIKFHWKTQQVLVGHVSAQ